MANSTPASTSDSINRFRAQFLERRASQASEEAEPGWLGLVRTSALERFLDRGFPTTRDEEWRFTNVAPLASTPFSLSAENGADAEGLKQGLAFAGLDAHQLVFVNGRFSSALSALGELPAGVVVTSLAGALSDHGDALQPILSQSGGEETPFSDLNQAFLSDGAFVYVPEGVVLERPVHLMFVTTSAEPILTHPRNVIIGEKGSQLNLVESYGGPEGAVYWTNAVTQVVASDNAVIDHYKLQRESESAFHIASVGYVQHRGAAVSNHSLSLGARLARHDIGAALTGEGADVTLNGLYVVQGSQHVDHHTVIDHAMPHCTSRELYKGVLGDASSGVFNGRVVVREDAQKTDSQQSNKKLAALRRSARQYQPSARDQRRRRQVRSRRYHRAARRGGDVLSPLARDCPR